MKQGKKLDENQLECVTGGTSLGDLLEEAGGEAATEDVVINLDWTKTQCGTQRTIKEG